jgi:alpha-1,2-mannosyltransferase
MKTTQTVAPVHQLPRSIIIAMVGAALLAMLALMALLPLPIPPYLDFQVLYQTNMALLRGISPYDHAGQVNLIAQLAGVAREQVYSLPFPYPPWYALSTLWLAWLPITMAARVWFGIGLMLLLASVWLLTDGWPPIKRLLVLGFAIFFLPVLGNLVVGQYEFPVLLGAALMAYACRREKAVLAAVAAALLTFKPHVGGFIILVVLIYLWRRGDAFAWRAISYCAVVGVALFLSGFLADRAWPVNYLRSLLAYRTDAGVATCGLCASLPALVANQIPGASGLNLALVISGVVLVLLIALWFARGRPPVGQPLELVAGSTLVILLASPYLLNYDFVLLLVPMAILARGRPTPTGWLALASAYVLPFIALGFWGRQGNFVFPLCAAILLFLLYQHQTRLLDVSPSAAYNH